MMKSARGKGTSKATKEAVPVDDRKASKRKAAPVSVADKGDKQRARKDKKAKKDPNKPKRPPTAFFVFLEEFRKTFKKENPNANAVSAEKAPYEAKAGKKKDEYGKLMDAYNNKKESDAVHGDDSDRSKSEVNDDDDEEDAPATKVEAPHEEEQEVEEQEEEEEDEEEEDADEDDED
ncbi:unnamed protein product [Linum tenue]|uniref:HMG box domain-containing protein n=1 Tax=Linum tenue TaxID=586396 RepID=A0AAV0KQ61_9ROSI|nr:unnamed protein product [Linum tenue]